DVACDTRPLLFCSHGAQPSEPAGVVDRQRRGLDEPVEETELALAEVVWGLVLKGDEADQRLARPQRRVEPRSGELPEARPAARRQVDDAQAAAFERRGPQWWREVLVA